MDEGLIYILKVFPCKATTKMKARIGVSVERVQFQPLNLDPVPWFKGFVSIFHPETNRYENVKMISVDCNATQIWKNFNYLKIEELDERGFINPSQCFDIKFEIIKCYHGKNEIFKNSQIQALNLKINSQEK